jgi:hypothetical protein
MNDVPIPRQLINSAYRAGEEYAWNTDNALLVIDWAAKSQLAILGGEVWLPTTPGPTIPTPYVYAWDMRSPNEDESWGSFVERTAAAAREYVLTFQWDENDIAHINCTPYFNLSISGEW